MSKDIALKLAYEALWITNHLNVCGKFATVDPVKADIARFAIQKAFENTEKLQKRKWVGLTNEDVKKIIKEAKFGAAWKSGTNDERIVAGAEQMLMEKNA